MILIKRQILIIRTALMVAAACVLPGCCIPLLVFPAPEAGAGKMITIADQGNRPIVKNGLLIVHRQYLLSTVNGEPRTYVVPIRDGVADLPSDCTIASVWLHLNPLHIFVYPGANIKLIPLIRGYYYDSRGTANLPNLIDINRGYLNLVESSRLKLIAASYWESILEQIEGRGSEGDMIPPIVLSEVDRHEVEAIISAELNVLRQVGL